METERQYLTPIFKDEEPELEIEWHTPKNNKLDCDENYNIENWECLGTGNNGREYQGVAFYENGILQDISDIKIIPW